MRNDGRSEEGRSLQGDEGGRACETCLPLGLGSCFREGEGARCSASTEEVAGYCLTQTQEGGDREENRPTMRRCDGDATGYGERRWRFPPMRRSGFDGNGLVGAAFFFYSSEPS